MSIHAALARQKVVMVVFNFFFKKKLRFIHSSTINTLDVFDLKTDRLPLKDVEWALRRHQYFT